MVSYTPSSEDVRLYEIAILTPHPHGQKEESELQKGINEIFAEAKAKEIFKDIWGRRGLAYRIGGFTEGNFTIYYMEMEPAMVEEIDNQLRILKGVLRHMIVKPPKNYVIASYANTYEQWKEQSRLHEEQRAQEKEDKLKKQVVDKAKRTSTRDVKKKDDVVSDKPAMTGEALTQELDKLISDKNLDI